MRPQVQITNVVGDLGGLPPTGDGVCLLVHNAPTAYTYTESVFLSLRQVEQAGISEANDTANSYLLWEHLKDFYTLAPRGEIHLLRVPVSATFESLFTVGAANNTALQNYLASQVGQIKVVGVSIVPATETHTTSISEDLAAAIPLAHTFAQAEYTRLRPIEIVFEGRKFSGTAAAATNLRSLQAGSVSVVVARNQDRAVAIGAVANNYAQLGLLLGTIASIHVGRNIGRVRTGALPVQNATFSGGQVPYDDFGDNELDVLSDKGYIYMDKYPTRAGWYWVDDHTCTAVNRSDAFIALNRVLNKASRIVVATYTEDLKDEIQVNQTTGLLPAIVTQGLQDKLEQAVKDEMLANPDPTRDPEISGVTVRIDPNQNVLATGKIVARLSIVPLGTSRIIETEVELVNPAS